tara:strand:+ start:1002 stop:1175 length:174 start_codon:yes stop_codon:yes gene_type:complete
MVKCELCGECNPRMLFIIEEEVDKCVRSHKEEVDRLWLVQKICKTCYQLRQAQGLDQ